MLHWRRPALCGALLLHLLMPGVALAQEQPQLLVADGDVAAALAESNLTAPLQHSRDSGNAEDPDAAQQVSPPATPAGNQPEAPGRANNSTPQPLTDAATPAGAAVEESTPLAPAPATATPDHNASTLVEMKGAAEKPGELNMPTIGWNSYFKALGGLCLILALVFGGLYAIRKIVPRAGLGGQKGRQLVLESALSLGPRKSVMVVRFLNKQLVLGVTDTRITCLHIQEDDHAPDESDTSPRNAAASPLHHGQRGEPQAEAPDNVLRSFADRLKEHL
ncbi:hypothetical protein JCM14635_11660 [Megalodesulfovibrio paquesii]